MLGLLVILCSLPVIDVIFCRGGFLFYVYMVLYVYLPGRFFCKRILKINCGLVADLLIDFYFGVFFIITIYYIFYFCNIMLFIRSVPLAFAFVEIYSIIKNKEYGSYLNKKLDSTTNELIVVLVIYFVLLLICLLLTNFSFPYQSSPIYSDRTYQISHIAGLATDNPFTSMTVYGAKLRYHIFYYMFLACSKVIFSYDAYILLNQYVVTHIPILFLLALYLLFCKYRRNLFLFVYFIFVIVFNLLSIKYTYFIGHVLSNHNSVGFAVPLFILTCYLTKYYLKDGNMETSNIILLGTFTFLLTGIKGPAGLLYASATVFYILLFNRNKNNLIMSFFIMASFFLAYYLVLYQKNGSMEFDPDLLFADISLGRFENIYNTIDGIILKSLFKLLFLPKQLLAHFNIFILPIIYYTALTIINFFKHKECGFEYYTIVVCAGIFGGFVIRLSGSSNFYFLMLVIPFLSFLSMRIILDFKVDHLIIVKIFLVIIAFIFAPMNFKMFLMAKNSGEVKKFVASKNDIFEYFRLNDIPNNDMFDGYNYIKQNTNKNSLIATNLLYQNNNPFDLRQHNLAAYGERHVYLEGYQYSGINSGYVDLDENIYYNNKIFSSDSNAIKYDLLKELGVNYIFYYKKIDDSIFDGLYNGFVKRYENDDVTIWQVK